MGSFPFDCKDWVKSHDSGHQYVGYVLSVSNAEAASSREATEAEDPRVEIRLMVSEQNATKPMLSPVSDKEKSLIIMLEDFEVIRQKNKKKEMLFRDWVWVDLQLKKVWHIENPNTVDRTKDDVSETASDSYDLLIDKLNIIKLNSFLDHIHSYFKSEGFHHIHTPYLQKQGAFEDSTHAIKLSYEFNGKLQNSELPTSPEYGLKKALCLGFDKIYELKSVFRNHEYEGEHTTEFLILEWYRSFSSLAKIEKDIKSLIESLVKNSTSSLRDDIAFETYTLNHFLEKNCGFKIKNPNGLLEWKEALEKHNVNYDPDSNLLDLWSLFAIEILDPELKKIKNKFIFIYDFPEVVAAMSVVESGWAQRFELYYEGLELANAYQEEFNVDVLMSRLKDSNRFESSDLYPIMIDHPPAAGVALGVERLMGCI